MRVIETIQSGETMKILAIMFTLLLVGCASEQEKIQAEQKAVCKKQIMAGQQPTEFCLNLLPEYRAVAGQPQQNYQEPQYAQQPIQQGAPQPVVIQAPAPVAQNNGMTDMLVGGLIGHAIGSAGNNSAPQVVTREVIRERPVYRPNSSLEANRPVAPMMATPNSAPPVVKKPAMDMSKLSASAAYNPYPAKPAFVAPKAPAMNMSRLGSSSTIRSKR